MNRITRRLLTFLDEEETEIFNNTQEGFQALHDGEEVMVILNPVGVENLYIQSTDACAVLTFGNWQQEYDGDPDSLDLLEADIRQIMAGDTYVWSVVSCRKLMVGLVSPDSIRYLENSNLMDMDYMSTAPFLYEIAQSQGQQDFLFWNPDVSAPQARFFLS